MKIILIQPGQPAIFFDHPDPSVRLEDLHRYLGNMTVDCRSMGTIPGSSRRADIWFDDEGLLNESVPNRRIGPESIICGPMLLCASEGPENVPFTDEEAETVRAHIERWFALLPPDYPKPEPMMQFIAIDDEESP